MTQPLEKSIELIDEINSLLHAGIRNEFDLRRIERKANQLMAADPASAHLVLGMVGSLKNNRDALLKHHNLALALGCDPYLGFSNFAVSLGLMGYYSEALEYARKACDIEKSSETISDVIDLTCRCARYEEALRYWNEIEKLSLVPRVNVPPKEIIMKLAAFSKNNALRDSDLAGVTEVVESITHEHRIKINSYAPKLYQENGEEWLSVEFGINASPKEVASLNIELAEKLVESGTANILLDKMSCRFVPDREIMKHIA